jgi:hypothetical protein
MGSGDEERQERKENEEEADEGYRHHQPKRWCGKDDDRNQPFRYSRNDGLQGAPCRYRSPRKYDKWHRR